MHPKAIFHAIEPSVCQEMIAIAIFSCEWRTRMEKLFFGKRVLVVVIVCHCSSSPSSSPASSSLLSSSLLLAPLPLSLRTRMDSLDLPIMAPYSPPIPCCPVPLEPAVGRSCSRSPLPLAPLEPAAHRSARGCHQIYSSIILSRNTT